MKKWETSFLIDMIYTNNDLTFAVCAYGENKYLKKCIESLLSQSIKCKIIVCTATPNAFIQEICSENNLELFINPENKGMVNSWNFATECANTKLFAICHQDDYYSDNYAAEILKAANKAKDLIFLHTHYFNVKNDVEVYKEKILIIKKILNFSFRFKIFWKNKFLRKLSLGLGNGICCPSVTFNKERVGSSFFDDNYRCNVDWDAWIRFASYNGEIAYVPKALMGHRIHDASATSEMIENSIRRKEDIIMFEKFWPSWIAILLFKFYIKGENSNEI